MKKIVIWVPDTAHLSPEIMASIAALRPSDVVAQQSSEASMRLAEAIGEAIDQMVIPRHLRFDEQARTNVAFAAWSTHAFLEDVSGGRSTVIVAIGPSLNQEIYVYHLEYLDGGIYFPPTEPDVRIQEIQNLDGKQVWEYTQPQPEICISIF